MMCVTPARRRIFVQATPAAPAPLTTTLSVSIRRFRSLQALFDLEASRRRDVLEVDAAEAWRDGRHGLDDRIDVFRGQADRKGADAAELPEEHRLAFHDRHRRRRP